MRKLLLSVVLLACRPAVAQHGQRHEQRPNVGVRQHGNGERPNVGVRQHGNEPQPEQRFRDRRDGNKDSRERDDHASPAGEGGFHERNEFRGYHWGSGRPREHWDGRRFDNVFFELHWGRGHRFYANHCEWYGPRWYPGSYFWYSGIYFVIVEPVPVYFYNDPVYVEYMDGGYYLVDPVYEGSRIHIDIKF